jgi:hypothetical protein
MRAFSLTSLSILLFSNLFLIPSSALDTTVFDLIHQLQHPSPASCSSRRLLIIHSDGKNFEGTGSITKAVMFGLSEAYHSNRTLIWGRFIPDLFTRAPKLECSNINQGGLYNCFFQKLSSCSIKDVSSSELLALGKNGYDETQRVLLQQPRRGMSLYIPPKELRAYPDIRLLWPSSFAAYAFRLKFSLSTRPPDPPLSCAHIRHGDIKALSYVYRNKGIYEFEDYYLALRKISPILSKNIFISSDSIETEEKVHEMRKRWERDDRREYCAAAASAASATTATTPSAATDTGGGGRKRKEKSLGLENLRKKATGLRTPPAPPAAAAGPSSKSNTAPTQSRTTPINKRPPSDDDDDDDSRVKESAGEWSDDDDDVFHPDLGEEGTTSRSGGDDMTVSAPSEEEEEEDEEGSWKEELVNLFAEDEDVTEDLLHEFAQRLKDNLAEEDDDDDDDDQEDHLMMSDDDDDDNFPSLSSSSSSSSSKPTDALPHCTLPPHHPIPYIYAEKRFRSEFGNHVAATRGGCVEDMCSFPHHHISRIIQDRQASTVEKDVYTVVKDSIEDISMLSHCMNGFVGQASSHLSTLAVFLLIYNNFQTPPPSSSSSPYPEEHTSPHQHTPYYNTYLIKYLDEDGIINGQYESSYLLGTYNAQGYIEPKDGHHRWESLEMRFGDLSPHPPLHPTLHADPHSYLFPMMSIELFDQIILSWNSKIYSHPICHPTTDLQELINYGVDLSVWHPYHAIQCWMIAMDIIHTMNEKLDPLVEEVVRENIVALRTKHFKQYFSLEASSSVRNRRAGGVGGGGSGGGVASAPSTTALPPRGRRK